ncbi:MAG: RidA family protein [Flavobacteriaceae bacterium]
MKIHTLFIMTFAVLCFFSCKKQESQKINYIKSNHESRKNAPFSDAVEVGNLLFLTGQIGKDHTLGKIVEGGIKAETKQVLMNIKEVLESNGSDLNHVVKCTVILSDIDDFSEMNSVYQTFFNDNLPARTTFAADLVPGAKIEIEVVAVKK